MSETTKAILTILASIPILLYVVPHIVSYGNIIATFVSLGLGILVSGYAVYAMAILIGAMAMKMEDNSSVTTIRNEDDK
jgi:uncharacterized membrane protein SpoIIM required for sporulation